MEIYIIMGLLVISVLLIALLFKIFGDYTTLQDKLKKVEVDIESIRTFIPGSKALIPNFALTYQKTDNFSVNYEVDVIEVSDKQIKVTAYNFTSDDAKGKDPSMKGAIIGFMKDTWVPKNKAELIMDQSQVRDNKINKILS